MTDLNAWNSMGEGAKKPNEPSLADLGLDEPVSFSKVLPPVESQYREPKAARSSTTPKPSLPPPPTVSPVKSSVDGASHEKPGLRHLISGWLLVILGFAIVSYFGIYETVVKTEGEVRNGYKYSGTFVHNTGLQQNRLLGFMSGLTSLLLGSISLGIGEILNRLQEIRIK